MKSNSACNLMSDKTKSEARNRVKRESDLFNPLISINYRLLIGQEVLLPIPLSYLQDTFKSARAMARTAFFCPIILTYDMYFPITSSY